MIDVVRVPDLWSLFLRLFSFWTIYHVIRALYNLSPLHPLWHIPGPKLAAATFLYEAWFDLVLGGMYTSEISRLHDIYGICAVPLRAIATYTDNVWNQVQLCASIRKSSTATIQLLLTKFMLLVAGNETNNTISLISWLDRSLHLCLPLWIMTSIALGDVQ